MTRIRALLSLLALLWIAAPATAAATIDYGPISHKGLKKLGAASTSTKLPLQLGLIANQSGLQSAVKSASNPSSSSYGKYPSLSTLPLMPLGSFGVLTGSATCAPDFAL